MELKKKGRKALPLHLKAKTTSIRLRDDRMIKFRKMGGVKWLNVMLDNEIKTDVMFGESNEA